MNPTRRTILQASAAAGAAASLAGCEKLISEATARLGEAVPSAVAVPDGASIDPAFHLLSRAAYGPWPGDVEHVRSVGLSKWIDEQLEPEKIDDGACTLRARRFETVYHDPGTCYEYKKPVLREEMARHTLLRAVYSKRQLFEVMVSFWTDHLNINIEKGDCIYLKPHDDREVVGVLQLQVRCRIHHRRVQPHGDVCRRPRVRRGGDDLEAGEERRRV